MATKERIDEVPQTDMQRAVSTQKHYMQFEIQPIEFCQRNKLGWCESNVIKYVCRHSLKNGIEDLHKAMSYLKTLIRFKETGKFETPDKI